MKSKQTSIKKRILLFLGIILFSGTHLFGQIMISGNISDSNSQPLIGVNVLIKGTFKGTISDARGNFSISVPDQNATLVFTYVGFQQKEIQVGINRSLAVVLEEELRKIDELVVIGYGTQKKIDISGSVAVVSTDDLENLPIKSAADALKGRASGVYVKSNTGQPGATPSILVRGRSSISAGNEPLLVVDGIPGVSWSEIDFNDVVSYTILKDAASASIYGSSGANGVILITTRRGQSLKDKISFSYNSGWSMPPSKLDVLNSEQALELVKELNESGSVTSMLGNQYISSMMIDTANLYHTDWQDEIFRVGRSNTYNLSTSGGNQNMTYYISGAYLSDKGYVIPSEYERYNFRANLDYKFSDRLKMSTDFTFMRNSSRTVTTGDYAWNGSTMLIALNSYPFLPVYNETGGFFINPFQPNVDSPPASINGSFGRGYGTNLNSKYSLTYEIFKGFSYQFDLMNQTNFSKGSSYRSRYHTDVGRQASGSASSNASQGSRWDVNNILRYQNSFGGHNIEVMGGFLINSSTSHSYTVGRRGYPSDTITQVYVETSTYPGLGISYSASEGDSEYKKYSYIGRLNYNFNSTYIFQFNVRSDGSSRFGPDSRWGTFPSASVAWRASNEEFMKGIKSISDLTIKYSAGVTGNDAFGNYLYSSFYRAGSNHGMWNNDDVAVGYTSLGGAAPNPLLRWEETFEQNLGLDLALFKNRIVLSTEIYDKNAHDLLYNASQPPHTGFSSGWVNIGQVNTRGFDIQLTTHNISTKDFRWSTTFTLSADKNKVVDMGGLGDQFRGDNIVREGEPIDAMFGWEMDGIFQNQDEINALRTTLPDGTIVHYQTELTAPGDIRFRNTDGYEVDSLGNMALDINGNPYIVISANDRQIIGKPNPDFHFGIDNRFSYKNIEFSVFFQGVSGANILSLTRREIERMDNYFNYSAVVLNRWKYEGQDTNIPRADNLGRNDNNRTSTRWMEDASFVRLKYITVAYKIPEKYFISRGIAGASVSVTGENLLTFTKYSLYDPEIATNGGQGIDMGGYPQARSFSVNVRLDF